MKRAAKRKDVLDAAKRAVGARHRHYGSPQQNFEAIARRWVAHIKSRYDIDLPLDAASVAVMSIDIKLARLEHDPTHADSWIDVAGYASCGGEIAGRR
jgi:hypothetical protein